MPSPKAKTAVKEPPPTTTVVVVAPAAVEPPPGPVEESKETVEAPPAEPAMALATEPVEEQGSVDWLCGCNN